MLLFTSCHPDRLEVMGVIAGVASSRLGASLKGQSYWEASCCRAATTTKVVIRRL